MPVLESTEFTTPRSALRHRPIRDEGAKPGKPTTNAPIPPVQRASRTRSTDTQVEIDSNKMTGHACSFVMTHKLIRLKCPRAAIADVLHRSTEPVRGSHSHCPQDQHTQHSQTKIEQWMSMSFHCLFGFRQALCSRWLLRSCFGSRWCTGSSD